MLKFFGSSNIKKFVENILIHYKDDLVGKVVVDIPAGSGYTSRVLKSQGAIVKPYDLFPEFFEVDGLECEKADLSMPLPIDSNSVDWLVFQEGIEHLPNQLLVLQELNRILKENGRMLLTTPNISHLRARMSYFLSESDLYKRLPANELDALWYSDDNRVYFGHVFLIGIQKLRVLAAASGFRIKKIHSVKISFGSVLLGFMYPLIVLTNVYAYFKSLNKKDNIDREKKKRVYGEILKYNLHPVILFGKHLFLEFEMTKSEQLDVHRKDKDII